MSGEHRILRNNYVEIVAITKDKTWLIDEFIVTFIKDNQILCTISDKEQYCSSPEIRITRPSLTQIEISYATAGIYISIVPYQYQYNWFDISIRMPYDLIKQSNGLCVTAPTDSCEIENSIAQDNSINSLSRIICEVYLEASMLARMKLNLSEDLEINNKALLACIHDYDTTNNKNFGASMVNMIVRDGFYKKLLNDFEFQSYTITSIDIVDNSVTGANIFIDTQIDIATTTSTTISTTTTTTSVSTTNATNLASSTVTSISTTTSTCSLTIKSIHNVLIFQFFSFVTLFLLF
ncbi:unnamed protein product [Adineta steineri]|uniref:Uncharacterized protein n=1 Tax=Adineta steineri TaxID=433720 RepID=A0A815HRV3_9BILA|nr:unnamed protein product [Adineta steineri]CAF1394266.1 unnamed protein product [Adineta steineri]CAF1486871.1 unnamed protein product [Adineta steineri]CAF3553580.1 unnamed protein product [Adineta steineri]CAF3702510.1 unnamed protein product [Adineta steineri]